MFNWFKNNAVSTNEKLHLTEQELATDQMIEKDLYANAVTEQTTAEQPVHGENGVCCGGCGGQG